MNAVRFDRPIHVTEFSSPLIANKGPSLDLVISQSERNLKALLQPKESTKKSILVRVLQ